MTYLLYIWTAVAMAGDHNGVGAYAMDWRPVGEYSQGGDVNAAELCQRAAQQLGLKTEKYRCVRNK